MDCLHGTGLATFQNSTLIRGVCVCGGGGGGGGERGRRELRPGDYKLYKLQQEENGRNHLSVFHVFFSLVLYMPMICLKKKNHKLKLTIFRRSRCGSLQNMKSEPG